MIVQVLFVVAGAVGALALGLAVNAAARDPFRWYGVGLVITALLYVLFAAVWGSVAGLGLELAGGVTYGGAALIGLRRRAMLPLALGWAMHPLWDAALHTVGAGADYTPGGYVAACIGIDLVLAGLLVRHGLSSRTRRPVGEPIHASHSIVSTEATM